MCKASAMNGLPLKTQSQTSKPTAAPGKLERANTAHGLKPIEKVRDKIESLLNNSGLEEYLPNFGKHNVYDEQMALLSDNHLKELGFDKLGDRLYMVKCVQQFKRDEKNRIRNESLWSAVELRHVNGCCAYLGACGCCACESCLPPLDQYKLTSASLKLKQTEKVCCCLAMLGIKGKQSIDNIDLSTIDDVDTEIPGTGPCSCGCVGEKILISSTTSGSSQATLLEASAAANNGNYILIVKPGTAEAVATMIRNTIEECQEMERS